jgi:hypothetical protein
MAQDPESVSCFSYTTRVKPPARPPLFPRSPPANPRAAPELRLVFSIIAQEVSSQTGGKMAVNKPAGDNARKGAVKKRSQTKTTLGGASAWTKRDRNSGDSWPSNAPEKRRPAQRNSKACGLKERRRRRGL